MTEERIRASLATGFLYRRYPAPEWFAAHEVMVGTSADNRGIQTTRRADFVALRFWGSGIAQLQGFEVKVSRADFLKEVQDPEKRKPLEDACCACYFVAPSSILHPDELPAGWGWLELQANGVKMRKAAQHRKPILEKATSVYHLLMKRMHDIRWYDQARRPALLDWGPEIFKLAGQEITPAQLEAMAIEHLVGIRERLQREAYAKGKEDGRAEGRGGRLGREDTAIMNTLVEELGMSAWEIRDVEKLRLVLRARGGRTGAALVDQLEALEGLQSTIDQQVKRLRATIETASPTEESMPQ